MNKRQVILLWVIAIALGAAVAAVKLKQSKSNHSATNRSPGQKLFEAFPAEDVASVEVKGAEDSVTLNKKDGKWTVAQRDDYPANANYVNDLIRTLNDLKITQGMEAGPSFAPRFGMDESSHVAADHGLLLTFKDSSGKEVAKIGLGKTIQGSAEESPMGGGGAVGRYVRNFADNSGFYAVNEMFPSVSAEPKRWLADGFISPEKIKSISVTMPDKDETAWTLTRDSEEAEYKLVDASEDEVLNATVTSPLKNLFSYARFEDVVPKDQLGERRATEGKRTATIETFEGFTYKITFMPTKAISVPPTAIKAATPPPATDNYFVTVDVNATLPKERKKEQDEKPDDAKAKDKAFTDRHKTLSEKLEKEKALAGRTFEVSKSTVEPLLNDRAALITKAAPAAAAANGPDGNVQHLPGGLIARPPVSATTAPIEAVTPPVSVSDDGDKDKIPAQEGTDH